MKLLRNLQNKSRPREMTFFLTNEKLVTAVQKLVELAGTYPSSFSIAADSITELHCRITVVIVVIVM